MKKKKWLLILIVAFPSFFWLILETSTINSRRLPFYGPKKAVAPGDTQFYKVPDAFYGPHNTGTLQANNSNLSRVPQSLYAIVFVNSKYKPDSYRLAGLWEYLNYKKQKVQHIPFILVTESENGQCPAQQELERMGQHTNVFFYSWPKENFEALTKLYFAEKPYYIDHSFFLLVDQDRHIRGYYDGRYVSELKRLIEEYQHLRLKEEKQKLIDSNEIKPDR